MAKKPKPREITEVTYRTRPVPVYPPPRTRTEWAEYDQRMRMRMSHYPTATKSYGISDIVVGYYDKHQ